MAVTHGSALRTTLANAAVDSVDDGAGAGYVEFQTAGSVETATVTCSNPAAGDASGPTATFNDFTVDSSATGGDTTKFVIKDSNTVDKILGTVSGSGGAGDIKLTTVSSTIPAGAEVDITSLTYTAPP